MPTTPRATYRLQLRPEFGFREAAAVTDYLAALGVSHLYASPYLQAAPGSTHGYDVVDPRRVNDELGGPAAHEQLLAALRDRGLRQILDIVPNHMSVASTGNVWWWDVLENGPSSGYSHHFDVDWEHPHPRVGNKVLMPILADHYGRVVEAGEIQVARRAGGDGHGIFVIRYHDHILPVAPRSLDGLLGRAAARVGSEELAFIAESFGALPLPTATDRESTRRRHRHKAVLARQLAALLAADSAVAAAVDEILAETSADPDALDDLLSRQNHRVAFWRTAGQELGYRRFFDITTLVGLRVEDETVFRDSHERILEWLAAGLLDGVRIDHPDGLRDPVAYLERLREAAPDAWIVVEKILEPGELLPDSWPVAGTTGYDFMRLATGVLVDPTAEGSFTTLYNRFVGHATDYQAMIREKKLAVLTDALAVDLHRLAGLLAQICERHRRYRDYTDKELRQALSEAIACLPVYRTYVQADDHGRAPVVHDTDRAHWKHALRHARANRPELAGDLFDFLGSLLTLEPGREQWGDVERELVMRVQQLTGAVMAKGVEDTSFYLYNRFIALNEVGGDPATFGVPLRELHELLARRSPHGMVTTSTHDTKRSEDVRARLAVLSELPDEWAGAVDRWSAAAATHRRHDSPDRSTEYLFWQTLVGAWPLTAERARDYMEKAIREAKAHTSWTRPDPTYEQGTLGFVEAVFADAALMADVEAFVARIVGPGRINSLTQKLLALTAPGVPDVYQGTELWDLSLVDPDNRRPVDYEVRRRLLRELEGASPEAILARMEEGLPKLWVVRQALALRRSLPGWAEQPYRALHAEGPRAAHVIAYARGEDVLVVAPRLTVRRGPWEATALQIPGGQWHNELTGEQLAGGPARIEQLLARFPVALYRRLR